MDTLVNAGLVLLFVLIGGVFAGTEMAIVTLRESQVRKFEEGGERAQKIAALVRNPNTFLSAVQIGVTLAGFFSSAYGASTLAPDLEPILVGWGLPEAAAGTVALVGMTLLIAYLSLVLGELVPKRLAMQRAVGFTRVLGPPLGALARLMRPIIWLLSVSTNAVVRLLGGDPSARSETISAEEVRDSIAANTEIHVVSKTILADVFEADDRHLVEVMRPRPDVEFLDGGLTIEEARDRAIESGFSRFPVTNGAVDDILGFVHIRDLMAGSAGTDRGAALSSIVRPILPLPGSAKVLAALTTMRRQHNQIVLVVDEYGGTEGIVTMEDLLEELVGEIYDEYDVARQPTDEVHRDGDVWEIDGGMIVEEVEELVGVDLEEGQYETIAGYVVDRLGRLADEGDRIEADHFAFTVIGVEGRRVTRIRIEPLPDDDADEEQQAVPAETSPGV